MATRSTRAAGCDSTRRDPFITRCRPSPWTAIQAGQMVQHMKSNVRRQIELPHQDNPSPRQESIQQGSPPDANLSNQQPLSGRRAQDAYATERRAANEPSNIPPQPYRLLPIDEVMRISGMKRTAVYQMIKSDAFPAPLKLGSASRWVDCEVYQWIASLMKQRDLGTENTR